MSDLELLEDLQDAVRSFKGKGQMAELGYAINGVMRVHTDRPDLYWANNGRSFFKVRHENTAPPIPFLKVWIRHDPIRGLYVDHVPPISENIALLNATGFSNTPRHHHMRYSGMAFPIDTRLFLQLSADKSKSSFPFLYIHHGRYDHRGVMYWWDGGLIDMGPYFPSNPGESRWGIIGINASAQPHQLSVVLGSTYASLVNTTMLPQLQLGAAFIPLTAVRLRHGATEFDETDFEALYPIATGVEREELTYSVYRILTDADGNVLSDANGNVLLGAY